MNPPSTSIRLIPCALVLAALATAASATITTHLDPVQDAVDLRTQTPLPGRQARALLKTNKQFAKPSTSLTGDLKIASKVARLLDKRFAGDPEFGPLLATGFAKLESDVQEARDSLDELTGRLGVAELDARIFKTIGSVDRTLAKAGGQPKRSKKANLLAKARKKIDKTEKKIVGDTALAENALYLSGPNNYPRVSFVPVRQTGPDNLFPPGDGSSIRTVWSDGTAEDAVGTNVLIIRWDDLAADPNLGRARVTFFRQRGDEGTGLAWTADTIGFPLPNKGLLVEQINEGIRVVFSAFEMEPAPGFNEAEGTLTLGGRLLLEL